ncbi:hypothetical protein GYMLUDRAFT_167285, partial [Collybiopsis luxurians FD-317 M1]
KEHICTVCRRRFSRPNVLCIHMCTHIGPIYGCPDPNRGREFAVRSNVRRHYRIHLMPANDS